MIYGCLPACLPHATEDALEEQEELEALEAAHLDGGGTEDEGVVEGAGGAAEGAGEAAQARRRRLRAALPEDVKAKVGSWVGRGWRVLRLAWAWPCCLAPSCRPCLAGS